MITCKLQGGVGNQFFQIATTHALALRNNDISGFDLESCHTPNQGYSSNKYRSSVLSKINDVNGYKFKHIYNEPTFSYKELLYNKDLCLVGYFQSEKYFNDYKEEVIDLFFIENIEINPELKNKTLTSIHVRRGDYLNHPSYHPVCSIDYYKEAMSLIGDSNFIFVSDDMNWVKENFKGDNIFYSDSDDELTDLSVIVNADHNIIANSSFSWWGAYLNRNKDKKIIAPKIWFGESGPKDTQDIIPYDWIVI